MRDLTINHLLDVGRDLQTAIAASEFWRRGNDRVMSDGTTRAAAALRDAIRPVLSRIGVELLVYSATPIDLAALKGNWLLEARAVIDCVALVVARGPAEILGPDPRAAARQISTYVIHELRHVSQFRTKWATKPLASAYTRIASSYVLDSTMSDEIFESEAAIAKGVIKPTDTGDDGDAGGDEMDRCYIEQAIEIDAYAFELVYSLAGCGLSPTHIRELLARGLKGSTCRHLRKRGVLSGYVDTYAMPGKLVRLGGAGDPAWTRRAGRVRRRFLKRAVSIVNEYAAGSESRDA